MTSPVEGITAINPIRTLPSSFTFVSSTRHNKVPELELVDSELPLKSSSMKVALVVKEVNSRVKGVFLLSETFLRLKEKEENKVSGKFSLFFEGIIRVKCDEPNYACKITHAAVSI